MMTLGQEQPALSRNPTAEEGQDTNLFAFPLLATILQFGERRLTGIP